MRIVYIKLKGYIGIYNGLGLEEIEIDLSQSKHKIILLTGINGCGKSTLLKAMSILPDNSSDFMPGVNAEKILRVIDENNIYDIDITSGALKSGTRGVSKASIKKNGTELNPNGNISSYKEIIFQEFDLDSNFITLTRLSSDDRGLADKSPAERKKFMSFIVDSLDTYNAIYKNLNKKSSVFKSYVNNLHTKIQNIGDEESIRSNLTALEYKRDAINQNIEQLKNSIVESQTILSMNDPNGTLQTQYENAEKNMNELKKRVDSSFREFSNICSSIGIEPSLDVVHQFTVSQNELLESHKQNLESANQKKLRLIDRKQTLTSEIESKSRKIESLNKDIDPKLRQIVDELKSNIEQEMTALSTLGVTDPDNVSKEELQFIFETINMILNMIDDFYSFMDEDTIDLVLRFNAQELNELDNQIRHQQEVIDNLKNEVDEVQKDYELVSVLDKRPKGCKINDCYFIKKAYDLKHSKYSSVSVEKKMQEMAYSLNNEVTKLKELSSVYEVMSVAGAKREKLNLIRDTIQRNSSLLMKSSIGGSFVQNFESNIASLNSFNDYRDLKDLTDNINAIAFYKRDISTLRTCEAEMVKQSNSEKLVQDLAKEIADANLKLAEVSKDMADASNEVYQCENLINTIKNKVQISSRAEEKGEAWLVEDEKYKEAVRVYEDIVNKSKSSISIMSRISEMNNNITNLQSQVKPLEEQISATNGQLMMLDQYKAEYEQYSNQYNIINTLKQYSSPTSGIQTLFISVYMNKTLELANNVLSMIFNGQYRLLDYVINANEFKIPFIGLGMRVDDISSGSTSQVCMMGMVMNLVLKYQASPKYNIACLDEIDGGLDTRNRLEFVNVLYKLVDILEIDQLFIISHSLELELSNVDIIRLRSYEDFGDTTSIDGNILYDFNQLQH